MGERREPLRLFKEAGDEYCNLCLKQAKLTDDHVPTKGWGNDSFVVVRRLKASAFAQPQADLRCYRGVTFETLCATCNNVELGGTADEALSRLVQVCRTQFERDRRNFRARLRPNAILRSILGHMVAVRNYTERNMMLDLLIREYLIGKKPLHPGIKVYVWPFLMRDQLVIARDFVCGDAATQEIGGVLNVIKFYPIAAVVQLDGKDFDAPSFHEFSVLPRDEQIEMHLSFSTPFDPKFPEEAAEVDPRYFVMAGKGYTDGIERAI